MTILVSCIYVLCYTQAAVSTNASFALRQEKLTEFDTCVQTLSSQTEQYKLNQAQTGDLAKKNLDQLLEGNKKANEECLAVVSQAQSAMGEGVGSLEKVQYAAHILNES